jgi:hypothetical protein
MKAIIIGGLGRSGTSQLYKWVSANPAAISFGNAESKFFTEPYGLVDLYRGLVSDYTYARGLLAPKEFRILMTNHLVDPAFVGQDSIIGVLDARGQSAYFEVVDRFISGVIVRDVTTYLTDEEFCSKGKLFIQELLDIFVDGDTGGRCFVEKTPHNALCPWIFPKLFEDVTFLWMIRDPRAVVYSTLKMPWGPDTLEGAIEYVRQMIKRYLDQRASNSHLEVRLEDLVYRESETVDLIENYCSFKIDPHASPTIPEMIEDWRKYLLGDDLRAVESLLAKEISAIGY